MDSENISRVEILEGNELIVVLESGGKSEYQYIYREAAEVYWDNDLKAFKSPPPKKWSHADWFQHIVKIAGNCSITLAITDKTDWKNVPKQVKEEICFSNHT